MGRRPRVVHAPLGPASTYAPGARRAYERSTRAHSTVEVDGADQTEVWATFRAGRRATPSLERTLAGEETIEIVASHDGHRRLPGRPVHRRTWTIGSDQVIVDAAVIGQGGHRVVSSVRLAPGSDASMTGESSVVAGPVHLGFDGPVATTVEVVAPGTDPDGWVSTGFGDRQPAPTVRVVVEGGLPVRLRTTIVVGDASDGGGS